MLNERQRRFAKALLACGDARQAYREAGYSERGAESGIRRLTALPEIRALLEQKQTQSGCGEQEKSAEKTGCAAESAAQVKRSEEEAADMSAADMSVADAPEILQYLTGLLRGENGSERERLRAAELLGKRHGLFSDKVSTDAATVMIVDDMDG